MVLADCHDCNAMHDPMGTGQKGGHIADNCSDESLNEQQVQSKFAPTCHRTFATIEVVCLAATDNLTNCRLEPGQESWRHTGRMCDSQLHMSTWVYH